MASHTRHHNCHQGLDTNIGDFKLHELKVQSLPKEDFASVRIVMRENVSGPKGETADQITDKLRQLTSEDQRGHAIRHLESDQVIIFVYSFAEHLGFLGWLPQWARQFLELFGIEGEDDIRLADMQIEERTYIQDGERGQWVNLETQFKRDNRILQINEPGHILLLPGQL